MAEIDIFQIDHKPMTSGERPGNVMTGTGCSGTIGGIRITNARTLGFSRLTWQLNVDEPIFRSVYFGKVKEIMEKAGTSPLYWCCNNNQNKGKRR
jgi:hypothetical protein